jgi:hypothetical protein
MTVLWAIIYLIIGIGIWAYFKVTTRRERDRWLWNGITVFMVIFIPVAVVTELLPFLLKLLS